MKDEYSWQARELAEANLLDLDSVTDEHRELLERLTREEVDALISVKEKLEYPGTLQTIRTGFIF